MENIFVISLKRSEERRQAISQELAAKQVSFTFFDAVDGKAGLPALATDYDFTKRLWLTSGKMPTDGEIGCYASHYALWLKCIELNEAIVIIEDDVILAENAVEIITLAFDKVAQYDFVRLESPGNSDCYVVEQSSDYQLSLMKDNANGTRAYALTPAAAAKLIKHRWCLPVDCFIGANYIHQQYSFVLSPYLVVEHDMYESTITEDIDKTSIYRKTTRELYSAYKKLMLALYYKRKTATLNK